MDAGGLIHKAVSRLEWVLPWENKIFGAFRPYHYADVHLFFHDLAQLPAGF